MKQNKFTANDRITVVEKLRDRAGNLCLKMVDGSIRREKSKMRIVGMGGKSLRRIIIKQRRKCREAAKENLK